MKFREWVGLQKEMVQEISGILAIALLTVNVGISVFLLVKDTGAVGGLSGNAYFIVPVVVMSILLAVWAAAYLWHFHGRMHFAKQRALATLNPYMTTDFHPHEWMLLASITLPHMRAQRDTMEKLGVETKQIESAIAQVEGWLATGRIPKDDFPKLLQRFLRAS